MKMRCLILAMVWFYIYKSILPTLAAEEVVQETATMFTAASGETVAAFEGSFQVPENRHDLHSRKIPIHYLRFPATGKQPGPPIVYLAGGPGGSGIATARGPRFPLFMALREVGDVIALDQRGTGASDATERCRSSVVEPYDQISSDEVYFELQRVALRECLAFWREQGNDARGYNTLESAADLDALRQHLGAEKISLWGISYGSHLALAALKTMDRHIHRVVIASAEGLDQTIKLPARTDAYFERLQAATDSQPEARKRYPDIKGLMRRVHAKLEAEPLRLSIPQASGKTVEVVFHRRDMQRIAAASIADPARAAQVLQLYTAVDAGFYQPLAMLVQRFFTAGEPISYALMPVAMDIASGIGSTRLAMVDTQARNALLGRYLNDTLDLTGVAPELDLGDGFRQVPVSAVPTLLLSGTLDGRTYVESQREAVAGLSQVKIVTVRNAGHNLFMTSSEVQNTVVLFLRGEVITVDEITVPLPNFVAP